MNHCKHINSQRMKYGLLIVLTFVLSSSMNLSFAQGALQLSFSSVAPTCYSYTDGTATVMATGGGEYKQRSGASYREILDVANWDNSVAVNVPGQSGQPGSEYYSDLLAYWAQGRYFPLAFSRKKVEEVTKHVLTLTPQTGKGAK